jgi:hypothetical protein
MGRLLLILIHFEMFTGAERDQTPVLVACKRPANSKFGEWLSLVEHLVRDQGVGGSNPLSPTIYNQ